MDDDWGVAQFEETSLKGGFHRPKWAIAERSPRSPSWCWGFPSTSHWMPLMATPIFGKPMARRSGPDSVTWIDLEDMFQKNGIIWLSGCWFGCHQFYFPINIGLRLSSQLTHIFQDGVALAHQPDMGETEWSSFYGPKRMARWWPLP